MQIWNDSLYLAKEKLLSSHYQNVVSLHLSGQEETGSAGEQPASNNLTDWNGQGGLKSPYQNFPIPRNYGLENPNIGASDNLLFRKSIIRTVSSRDI